MLDYIYTLLYVIILALVLVIIYIIYINFFKEGDKESGGDDIKEHFLNDGLPRIYSSDISDEEAKKMQEIIEMYKVVYNREPTEKELKRAKRITLSELKTKLLNSKEAVILYGDGFLIKNDSDLNNIVDKIKEIYKYEKKLNMDRDMVLPLRDCYIYLRFNDNLFRAMLNDPNYRFFETLINRLSDLNTKKIIALFNENFDIVKLRINANQIIKHRVENKLDYGSVDPYMVELNKDVEYINDVNRKQIDIENQINDIINETNKIYNKDADHKLTLSNDGDDGDSNKGNLISRAFNGLSDGVSDVVDSIKDNIKKKKEEKDDEDGDSGGGGGGGGKCNKDFDRLYNPIEYRQVYPTNNNYRPPICVGLDKQESVQPVFLESKLLFNASDYKTVFKNTQIGSIMPKFEYREYQEVKI